MAEFSPDRDTITILGIGHVGLPTALGLAELGWSVMGADHDTSKIETNQPRPCGQVPPQATARALGDPRKRLSESWDCLSSRARMTFGKPRA